MIKAEPANLTVGTIALSMQYIGSMDCIFHDTWGVPSNLHSSFKDKAMKKKLPCLLLVLLSLPWIVVSNTAAADSCDTGFNACQNGCWNNSDPGCIIGCEDAANKCEGAQDEARLRAGGGGGEPHPKVPPAPHGFAAKAAAEAAEAEAAAEAAAEPNTESEDLKDLPRNLKSS